VVRHPKRAIAAGDDRGVVPVDPARQPRRQLVAVARGDDVQIGVERAARKVDGLANAIGACAASPLVQADGRARPDYGSASRIAAAYATDPVRKGSVSSFV